MGLLLTLLLAYSIFLLISYMMTRLGLSQSNEKEYETEFLWHYQELIEQYYANTLPFIPLGLEHRHPENLSILCEQHPRLKIALFNYATPVTVQKFGPRIEVQFIGFRRVDERYRPRRPLRIELIRCNEKFAISTAGRRNHYSYFLTRDSLDDSAGGTTDDVIFYIAGKFKHREGSSNAGTRPITPNEIPRENRSSSDPLVVQLLANMLTDKTEYNNHND